MTGSSVAGNDDRRTTYQSDAGQNHAGQNHADWNNADLNGATKSGATKNGAGQNGAATNGVGQNGAAKNRTLHNDPGKKSAGDKLMVALDVDGTLVDHDGHMSAPVREAAQAVVAAGHQVTIATGRSLNATLPVIEHIGIENGYAVCSNGGVILRIDSGLPDGYEVVHKATFDPGPALRALRKRLPSAKYALEDEDFNFLSTERFQDASFGVEAIGVDFQTMLEATAVRVVVFSTENTPEEFHAAIRHVGLAGVTYSVGWTAWLDIAAAGVTKASALEQLRDRLGIEAARTVAVGDGRNDIEMLGWARRGVAMGQAPVEVVAAANEVTKSVYDDGAAYVLRSLL